MVSKKRMPKAFKKLGKVKLMNMELCGDHIHGYLEFDTYYADFSITKDNQITIHARFPKKDYPSYQFFADFIGKWDAYAFLLKDPIPMDVIDFETLAEIYRRTPALRLFESE